MAAGWPAKGGKVRRQDRVRLVPEQYVEQGNSGWQRREQEDEPSVEQLEAAGYAADA